MNRTKHKLYAQHIFLLLSQVLDKNKEAADLLSLLVHSSVSSWSSGTMDCEQELQEIPEEFNIDVDDLGIWIDPIGRGN